MDLQEQDIAYYLAAASSDPNLKDVQTISELHERLAYLSALCIQEDAKDQVGNVFSQLTFDGSNPYPIFEPNMFKKDVGCDGRKITSYYRYAVKSREHCIAAIEYACDSKPSLILGAASNLVSTKGAPLLDPPPALAAGDRHSSNNSGAAEEGGGVKSLGKVFQGGYKAVGNAKFLKLEGVTHIVNTAKVGKTIHENAQSNFYHSKLTQFPSSEGYWGLLSEIQ